MAVPDFDKEELLAQNLRDEQAETEKLTKMFERLAQEVFDVAQVDAMVSLKVDGEAGKVVPPVQVLDGCLGHLQDLSTKVETQERKLRDQGVQAKLLKDKMKLMENSSTVA